MSEDFFQRVYSPMTQHQTRDFYDDWAAQYEKDVGEAGYATPTRAAALLAGQEADKEVPILDVGCGTGLSGVALRAAGFSVIDGVDPSTEMLAKAGAKGAYRTLAPIDPGAPLPTGYGAITAIGVIGCGAAPVSLFDDIMRALEPGGSMTLSYNDHALEVPEYMDKLRSYTETGRATLEAEDYGPHLPDLGSNSMSRIFVLRKA